MPGVKFRDNDLKILSQSKKITNRNRKVSKFFNNCSMGRVLDVFISNPNIPIYTDDIRRVADNLSRQALYDNIPKLVEKGLVTEEFIGQHKFFTYHGENKLAKHLEKLRDML